MATVFDKLNKKAEKAADKGAKKKKKYTPKENSR